jgi:hypothetical protein
MCKVVNDTKLEPESTVKAKDTYRTCLSKQSEETTVVVTTLVTRNRCREISIESPQACAAQAPSAEISVRHTEENRHRRAIADVAVSRT